MPVMIEASQQLIHNWGWFSCGGMNVGYELLAVYLMALLVVAVCIVRYSRPIQTGIGWVLGRAWRWMVRSCFENPENCRDLRGIQNYIDRCLKSANAYEDYGTGKSAEEIAFEVILLMHFTHEEMTGLAWAAVAKLVQVRLENIETVFVRNTPA